ncbi:MAG: hypothetical protein PVI86_03885 [Phycisphaerae bacterium]
MKCRSFGVNVPEPVQRAVHAPDPPGVGCRALLLVLLGALLPGCGFTQGEILYFMGVGRGQKIEAEFRLTDGPVMILVDDPSGRVDWPAARHYLFDALAQELLKHKAAKKLIPRQTVDHLRQSVKDFEKRGCREIGERAGARQVLWIQVEEFMADANIQDTTVAAHFAVTVKVINAAEKERRSRVRLWPPSPRGHLVSATLGGADVSIAKTRDAISKELTAKLATDVAKLFYDHRLGDFEREK